MDIVVSEGAILVATVILSFIVNQGLVWAGVSLSELAKKLVVFTAATGLTGLAAYKGGLALPVGGDPMVLATALVANAGLVFKAAQPVYDRLWKGLLNAK